MNTIPRAKNVSFSTQMLDFVKELHNVLLGVTLYSVQVFSEEEIQGYGNSCVILNTSLIWEMAAAKLQCF